MLPRARSGPPRSGLGRAWAGWSRLALVRSAFPRRHCLLHDRGDLYAKYAQNSPRSWNRALVRPGRPPSAGRGVVRARSGSPGPTRSGLGRAGWLRARSGWPGLARSGPQRARAGWSRLGRAGLLRARSGWSRPTRQRLGRAGLGLAWLVRSREFQDVDRLAGRKAGHRLGHDDQRVSPGQRGDLVRALPGQRGDGTGS